MAPPRRFAKLAEIMSNYQKGRSLASTKGRPDSNSPLNRKGSSMTTLPADDSEGNPVVNTVAAKINEGWLHDFNEATNIPALDMLAEEIVLHLTDAERDAFVARTLFYVANKYLKASLAKKQQ